jgi:hypothetical protein
VLEGVRLEKGGLLDYRKKVCLEIDQEAHAAELESKRRAAIRLEQRDRRKRAAVSGKKVGKGK